MLVGKKKCFRKKMKVSKEKDAKRGDTLSIFRCDISSSSATIV